MRPEPRRVLITGIAGSGASYLAEYIVNNHPNVEVSGLVRWHSGKASENLAAIADRVTLHECDLTDALNVYRVVREVHPDWVFHLAAHANVRASFDTPSAVVSNNIIGTLNLLEAVKAARSDWQTEYWPGTMIQMVSSSEVYGIVPEAEQPIAETATFSPASPYAVSKATQDLLGRTYQRAYGLNVITTRMFTYINPRRPDLFATSFAKQIAEIEVGKRDVLRHGNLDSWRTIIDVRDGMRAYWLAMERGEVGGIYNIAGRSLHSVRDILDCLVEMATVLIPCEQDPALLRPADVTYQRPDTTAFDTATGFEPEYTLGESLRWLLDSWRDKVRR